MPLPKSMIEAELPARAQQGDENALAALITRMMPAIRKGAADCTAPGLDFDDAVQEGLIGLFRAVREYDPAVGPTFAAFAAASIRHAQQDARRAALRKKHAPLNFSVPLPDAQQSTDTRPGPEEIAISGEQYADTMRRMQTELSELERHLQREVLFIDPAIVRAGEFPPVPGVDDHDFDAVRNIPRRRNVHKNSCGREGE